MLSFGWFPSVWNLYADVSEQAEYSETSAYKFQTPGNHPKESIQNWISLTLNLQTSIKQFYRWNVKMGVMPKYEYFILQMHMEHETRVLTDEVQNKLQLDKSSLMWQTQ